MSSSAFVSAAPVLARSSTALSTTSFVSRRCSSVAPSRRSSVVMMAKEKIPQGFTGFSEVLNGRAAMLGFVLALVTEAITGQGIIGQLSALGDLSTITHALGL